MLQLSEQEPQTLFLHEIKDNGRIHRIIMNVTKGCIDERGVAFIISGDAITFVDVPRDMHYWFLLVNYSKEIFASLILPTHFVSMTTESETNKRRYYGGP